MRKLFRKEPRKDWEEASDVSKLLSTEGMSEEDIIAALASISSVRGEKMEFEFRDVPD
jgi:hypothetical protein